MPVAGGGDDHLLSTVAETRHELVSVSFLHIYKAGNVCVSLFEKKGDTKIYHCAKPLVVYKRRPGNWPFFPPRDFVVRSPRGRPFGPALDQFRYYRVERKLATHPNVLTTSFRYGDKSSGVVGTAVKGVIADPPPLLLDFGRYKIKTFSFNFFCITTCPHTS